MSGLSTEDFATLKDNTEIGSSKFKEELPLFMYKLLSYFQFPWAIPS
jgi:hypothetical protein